MRSRFIAGTLSGLIVTALGYLAYLWAELPFLPASFSDLLFKLIPGGLQAEGIATLGALAKPLALYLFMLAQIVILGIASIPRARDWAWMLNATLILVPIYALLYAIGASPQMTLLGMGISMVGLIALHRAISQRILSTLDSEPVGEVYDEADERSHLRRRQLLTAIGTATGMLVLWPLVSGSLRTSNAPERMAVDPVTLPPQNLDDIPGLQPALTPSQDFYYVSKNIFVHSGDGDEPLIIDGLVDTPLSFSIEELRELEPIEEYVTLMCVDYEPHNSLTNDLISNALWKGVPLSRLLIKAGNTDPEYHLEMHATDGFSTGLPINYAFEVPETMVAYEMNGQALSNRHGFPARLIIPGIYGYKNIKHVNSISVRQEPYYGYWEARGWAAEAPVKLMSRISTPQEGQRVNVLEERWIAGIAYSGRDGISKVEVSLDDGRTWHETNLEPPLSQYAWTRWAFSWLPEELGEFMLLVRAYDGIGNPQDTSISRAFPSGATGLHRVRVNVIAP